MDLDGHVITVSPSIGIGIFPRDGATSDALLKNADAAMYLAKERGRSNYQFFNENLSESAHRALALEAKLRVAIENDEFQLHYQPQMRVDNGAVTGIDGACADLAFIGCGGFADDGGMTDYSVTAAETRGKMILCGRAYLVADQTKFMRRTPFRTPNMSKCSGVIVDRMPDRQLASAWTGMGWEIIVAK